ncbi:hypothetical protein [Enterococcus termitis]|uniref:hypothetical protein n=1 Tax=Enterococcus termitis TaxID=332950 RepID=UPI0009126F77|nr:hypothetical protein [Enterococcus termitis]OJG97082.1 hypothetical protein RV18_GL001231 [Enterococcus termitis]
MMHNTCRPEGEKLQSGPKPQQLGIGADDAQYFLIKGREVTKRAEITAIGNQS